MFNLRTIPLLLLCIDVASSLAFQMPKLRMPWDPSSSPTSDTGALKPGDTIAVIGASGNVGKLVALRLSDTYKVNGVVRDVAASASFFGDKNVELFQSDLLDELDCDSGCPPSLLPALKGANAIVICTGTTAFPTKAWSRNEQKEVTSDVISSLLQSKFNVKQAIESLDELGLNTPYNIDARANQLIYSAWNSACSVVQKRAILLSSIGVQRRDQMPFPILNACGVLDAKAIAEQSLIDNAKENGYSYTIVRPGQLFGGPYDNNYYLGTLFQLDKDSDTQDVEVGLGDELLGDTLRSTLAEVTAQICEGGLGLNTDFTVVNVKGDAPSGEGLKEKIKLLVE
mmetsp:Transcript_8594/g.19314  ORF Transcript_8594/g.19314 Transcript_8594/m.19314 type:complete len:341 (+) Transcript_8594:124-1146(+)|eukprot:CAMPEP_0172297262 /NCGR_PEP_ID=MMETSP1058-20130122/354_1 /TAXON_ID=83371 /ORGANISM="Detonula confervacea, Strain CCMP 353" /LENGTH=340 /DNA_ID=CAMNT_0013006391 /DNA_START=63 /DNA_END=1085 /DNA_ORIENTATION=+